MADFVAYYRVSTDRQGASGLGLDAQRQAVACQVNGGQLVAEFTEIESGRRHTNRPQLLAALEGVPSEKGKNRTLGCREWPERSVFSGRYAGVAAPEVIAGQVDVFPAQRR